MRREIKNRKNDGKRGRERKIVRKRRRNKREGDREN
jgi:hypothetical protein